MTNDKERVVEGANWHTDIRHCELPPDSHARSQRSVLPLVAPSWPYIAYACIQGAAHYQYERQFASASFDECRGSVVPIAFVNGRQQTTHQTRSDTLSLKRDFQSFLKPPHNCPAFYATIERNGEDAIALYQVSARDRPAWP